MKRITLNELPETLTPEILDILVDMVMESPKKTRDWAEISEVLDARGQLRIVLDKVIEVRQQQEEARKDAMSDEEKAEEARKWEQIKNDRDPNKFYGNMGEPETPEQYKAKYGVWPPGYGENGNKL